MTTIKTFADELAAVVIAGVVTRFDGIPKQLKPTDLPAQWSDLPDASIDSADAIGNFGTFEAAAARYTGSIFIAVDLLDEGYPDRQRTAVLDMAERVETWAIQTPYAVQIYTKRPIVVAGIPYRGVTAVVIAPDMD